MTTSVRVSRGNASVELDEVSVTWGADRVVRLRLYTPTSEDCQECDHKEGATK